MLVAQGWRRDKRRGTASRVEGLLVVASAGCVSGPVPVQQSAGLRGLWALLSASGSERLPSNVRGVPSSVLSACAR